MRSERCAYYRFLSKFPRLSCALNTQVSAAAPRSFTVVLFSICWSQCFSHDIAEAHLCAIKTEYFHSQQTRRGLPRRVGLRGRLAELGKEGGGGDEVSAAVDDGHSAAPRHRRLHVAPLRKTPATYHEYHGVVPPSRPLPRPDRGGGGCAEDAEGVARDKVGGVLGREAVARQRRC